MFSKYFGNYLLNRGLIRPDQLTDALEYQRSMRLKLGVIAVNAGYMTPAQVEEIHNMQKKVDKRFGELAIEKGYITEQQLEEMLATQRQGHLMLGQALVDRGHLTIEQLQEALDNYRKEYGMSSREFNVVRKDDTLEIEQIFRDYGEALLGKLYSDYVTLLIKNLIRFVDDNPTVEINQLKSDITAQWFASQEIYGKINMLTAIACDRDVFVKFAAKFAQEDITEPDELAQASVGEFLNLHNGIFLVNMSNNGVELEMNPQQVETNRTLANPGKAYVITCHMTWGRFDVILV